MLWVKIFYDNKFIDIVSFYNIFILKEEKFCNAFHLIDRILINYENELSTWSKVYNTSVDCRWPVGFHSIPRGVNL